MDWNTIYPGPEPPTEAELAAYVETPLWTELVHYLSQAYHTDPVCTGPAARPYVPSTPARAPSSA